MGHIRTFRCQMVNNLLKTFYQTSANIFETLIGKTVKEFYHGNSASGINMSLTD